MRKALTQTIWLQGFNQAGAQAGNALAHGVQLADPEAVQFTVSQDAGDHCRAVGGRRRPQIARDKRQLAAHVLQLRRSFGADDQRAGALAVQAEILRAGTGDQQLGQLGGKQAHGKGVLLQAIAKTLVGEVDQRQQLAGFYHLQHALPVTRGEVEAGGVVAAGVQQHHIAFGHVGEGGDHRLDIQLVVRADIGVMADAQAGGSKDALVDRPGRIAQPDATARQAVGDKVRTQAQRTGAARRLGGASAFGQQRAVGAQYQLAKQVAKQWVAVAADIALSCFAFHQPLFGELYRAWNWRQSLSVLVHAHAQIQLGRVAVSAVGVHQAENRVARHSHNVVEMAHLRPSALAASTSVRAAMMKSLRCRPRISWLHQVTVTLPHSVSSAGWWPTSSAMAPTALLKARAWRKFLNR